MGKFAIPSHSLLTCWVVLSIDQAEHVLTVNITVGWSYPNSHALQAPHGCSSERPELQTKVGGLCVRPSPACTNSHRSQLPHHPIRSPVRQSLGLLGDWDATKGLGPPGVHMERNTLDT